MTAATPRSDARIKRHLCAAAHPPFAGAHPGVASHASPRFWSSVLIDCACPGCPSSCILSRHPIPPAVSIHSYLAITRAHRRARDSRPAPASSLPASPGHLRHSPPAASNQPYLHCRPLLRCSSPRSSPSLHIACLPPAARCPPVYSGIWCLHATPIATASSSNIDGTFGLAALPSTTCDWRLDRSALGPTPPRRIVSRPARRNPTQRRSPSWFSPVLSCPVLFLLQ